MNTDNSSSKKEQIFIVACVLLAIVGATWFYLTQGRDKVTLEKDSGAGTTNNTAESNDAGIPPQGTKVVVHVAGNVNNPGVYELRYGSRVKDAIAAAGGENGNAEVNALNLAEVLTDGEKVFVPSQIQNAPPAGMSTQTSSPSVSSKQPYSGPVSINNADAATLETLPGIGPALANRIIQYRSQKPFTTLEELKKVPGIGDKKFNDVKNSITLN